MGSERPRGASQPRADEMEGLGNATRVRSHRCTQMKIERASAEGFSVPDGGRRCSPMTLDYMRTRPCKRQATNERHCHGHLVQLVHLSLATRT